MSKGLPIAGIIPFSATDWPGKLTATAFVQGCPLRCVYCHNAQLQPFGRGADGAGERTLGALLALLDSRRGLLDAAVISGGEPTAVPGLGDAIRAIHAAGFDVGLHTCGYAPKRLARLLDSPETTPEWVGLDIKALPRHMHEVTGCSPAVERACWESLKLLDAAGVDVQLRTTLWEGSVIEAHLGELRAMIESESDHCGNELVIQWARDKHNQPFQPA